MPISATGTAYDVLGRKNAPVIALIHGLGLNRDVTWRHIAPALSEYFRVLNYDLLGHGESALPEGRVNLAALSKQLIILMDELHIPQAALVGFSLGGMINRRCAMDYPNRVSALAVLNSPHERGEEQQALVEARAKDTHAGGPSANIDTTLARWFTSKFLIRAPDQVAEVRDVVTRNNTVNYAAHRWVLAEGVRELIRPTPAITHPTLVMTCTNDSGSTPAMTHAITAEIPNARSIIVPELQHLGLLEQPHHFTRPLIEFLQGTLT